MDGWPYISHVLRVHVNGLTSLGCNTYTWIPSIQATDHHICGPRFCRICKPPSHPQGGVGCDIRYSGHGWLATLFTCLVNACEMFSSLRCNTYTWIPSIQTADHHICGPMFCRIYKPPSHPKKGVGCDTRYNWSYMCTSNTLGCHSSKP